MMSGFSSVRSAVYVTGMALVLLLSALVAPSSAAEVRVAVASNFTQTLSKIAAHYQKQSGHSVSTIPGSSGRLYSQICNGAPFDVFLAADSLRPTALETAGLCVPGTRFTYALGSLVLWTADASNPNVKAALLSNPDQRIAIANPQLAPYGHAAFEVLTSIDLWDQVSPHLVRGENVAQTFQFVHSGNATMGFVSQAQVLRLPVSNKGAIWLTPKNLYSPIKQQAVLLRDTAAARGLLHFLTSTEALRILQADGYDTP